jgi:prepilin-type N-terminal cleavage/methylation domain-containing protein
MVTGTRFSARGFTLIEFMLVIVIIGLMLSVFIPQCQRSRYEAKIGLVRQNASEAGSYVVAWAQKQAMTVPNGTGISFEDFLTGSVNHRGYSFSQSALVNHYTGHTSFDGVEKFIRPDVPIRNPFCSDAPIRNPFNHISIFDRLNDDTEVPGKQPGLLFLISNPTGGEILEKDSINELYFIYTGMASQWYGSIDATSVPGIRRGIFVTKFFGQR